MKLLLYAMAISVIGLLCHTFRAGEAVAPWSIHSTDPLGLAQTILLVVIIVLVLAALYQLFQQVRGARHQYRCK